MSLRGRYSPFNLEAFNARLLHSLLGDIPSAVITGHTGYLDLGGTRAMTGNILFSDDASTIGSDTTNDLLTFGATGLTVNGGLIADSPTLVVDAVNHRVLVGTTSGDALFHVWGDSIYGPTSGGTNNGNFRFAENDRFPFIAFRSASTIKAQIISDVATGRFVMDYNGPAGGNFTVRSTLNNDNTTVLRANADGKIGYGGEKFPITLAEWTNAEPYLTLHNSEHEDSDGGRESKFIARGEQTGGEETILGQIIFSHDGAVDDQKGKMELYTNDGDDGTSPTLRMSLFSNGDIRHFFDATNYANYAIGSDGDLTITTVDSDGAAGDINLRPNGKTTIGDGTNEAVIEADGTLKFNGTATVFDELPPAPIIGAKLGSTAPTLTTFKTDIEQYTFDATNDYVIGATEITHKWKEGTVLVPHIHWATNGNEGTAKGVQWQLKWSVGDATEAFSAQVTSVVDVTIDASTADRTHFMSDFNTTLDGTNLKINAYICWRLERIGTAHGNGEPAADPFGIGVGFHAEMDTVGSRSITTK